MDQLCKSKLDKVLGKLPLNRESYQNIGHFLSSSVTNLHHNGDNNLQPSSYWISRSALSLSALEKNESTPCHIENCSGCMSHCPSVCSVPANFANLEEQRAYQEIAQHYFLGPTRRSRYKRLSPVTRRYMKARGIGGGTFPVVPRRDSAKHDRDLLSDASSRSPTLDVGELTRNAVVPYCNAEDDLRSLQGHPSQMSKWIVIIFIAIQP